MIKIATAQMWVHDQDEALAFYTEKLGMEVRSDVTIPEFGNFRWLTVGPPGQQEMSIVLMAIPGPPVMRDPDFTFYSRVLADHECSRLIVDGRNLAIDRAVDAQPTAEQNIALYGGAGTDQAVQPLLRWLRLLAFEHGALLGKIQAAGRLGRRLSGFHHFGLQRA